MSRIARMLGVLLLLGAAGTVLAVAPEVKDDGKFFSADAVKKADAALRDIAKKHQRDVLIETYAAPPAADVERVKAMDGGERRKYFLQWAKDRAAHRVVNGVYVLVCKEPEHLTVGLPGKTPALNPAFRAKLEERLRDEFTQKRYDEGLLAAVTMCQEQLDKAK